MISLNLKRKRKREKVSFSVLVPVYLYFYSFKTIVEEFDPRVLVIVRTTTRDTLYTLPAFKYSVKPVVYHGHRGFKALLPSTDRSVYYYPDVFAFEMEVVCEEPVPLRECTGAIVNPSLSRELREELALKLRGYGVEVEFGNPVENPLDRETYNLSYTLLGGELKKLYQYWLIP